MRLVVSRYLCTRDGLPARPWYDVDGHDLPRGPTHRGRRGSRDSARKSLSYSERCSGPIAATHRTLSELTSTVVASATTADAANQSTVKASGRHLPTQSPTTAQASIRKALPEHAGVITTLSSVSTNPSPCSNVKELPARLPASAAVGARIHGRLHRLDCARLSRWRRMRCTG